MTQVRVVKRRGGRSAVTAALIPLTAAQSTAVMQTAQTVAQGQILRYCPSTFQFIHDRPLIYLSPYVKGTVSRDFRPSAFFHQSTPPRALIHGLKPFRIWLRNRREIRDNR
jgi:hypothetical protein